MPRPPTAPAGFGFPSVAVTMSDDRVRFLRRADRARTAGAQARVAVPAGRRGHHGARVRAAVSGRALAERPGRRHAVRHPVAAGAGHRLSPPRRALVLDAAAGARLFYGAFALAALWHAPRSADALLAKFDAAAPTTALDRRRTGGRRTGPSCRSSATNATSRRRWPLDVQFAGPLEPLQRAPDRTGLARATAGGLGGDGRPARRRHAGRASSRCCRRRWTRTPKRCCCCIAARTEDEQYALRLWPAPAALARRHAAVARHAPRRCAISGRCDVAALWLPVARRRPGPCAWCKRPCWAISTSREAPHPSQWHRCRCCGVRERSHCPPVQGSRASAATGPAARAGRRSAAAPAAARPASGSNSARRQPTQAASSNARCRRLRMLAADLLDEPFQQRRQQAVLGPHRVVRIRSHHVTSATCRPLSRTRARSTWKRRAPRTLQGQQAVVAAAEILDQRLGAERRRRTPVRRLPRHRGSGTRRNRVPSRPQSRTRSR